MCTAQEMVPVRCTTAVSCHVLFVHGALQGFTLAEDTCHISLYFTLPMRSCRKGPEHFGPTLLAFGGSRRLWCVKPCTRVSGLDFLWGAEAQEGRHLVFSGGLLPAGTGVDTSLEQCVGRLSHDRTTERHWQRLGSHRATVPKEVPCGSSTVAVRLSSVPFLGGGGPGWSGGLSLGPLPPRTACRRHRRIAPTAR